MLHHLVICKRGFITQNQLLTAIDAARFLSLSASTLAKMRLSGNSPRYVKMGRRVAYRQTDLENWISAKSFQSTSEYPNAKQAG